MKLRNSAIAAILGCAAAVVPLPVAAQTAPATGPAAQTASVTIQDGRLIRAIETAQDPSSAINAYADAKAAEPNNLAVQQAYLRKMVSFQLPEMAEAQAREIINRDTRDPIAWAVLAYMHAKEDMTNQALTEIAVAVQRAPDDEFVMRTAGQLLAWYDVKADKNQIPEALRNSVEGMRRDLAGRAIFTDTYAKATDAYRAAATTEPAPGNAGVGIAPVAPVVPAAPPDTYVPANNGYPYYTDYGAPYYQPWYPYNFGFYPGFLIVSNGFGFHHHHHHHDFDHDGGFHHGHGHDGFNDLPLVFGHHRDGFASSRFGSATGTGVVSIRTPHRGIEAGEPARMSVSSVTVRGANGGPHSIEIIRPSQEFRRSSVSIPEMHTTPHIMSQGIRPAPMAVPMRGAPNPMPMTAPHMSGFAPSISSGGINAAQAQPAAGGGRR